MGIIPKVQGEIFHKYLKFHHLDTVMYHGGK